MTIVSSDIAFFPAVASILAWLAFVVLAAVMSLVMFVSVETAFLASVAELVTGAVNTAAGEECWQIPAFVAHTVSPL